MNNSFFRTAILKDTDKNILLMKIRLPKPVDGEYGAELTDKIYSFYLEIYNSYMRSAEKFLNSNGGKIFDYHTSPLTFSVNWKSCDGENPEVGNVTFLRIEKLYSRTGVIKLREIIDSFDIMSGFLLK